MSDRIRRRLGTGERIGYYVVPTTSSAVGSTLGGPKMCMAIKATGAIEKVYSVDAGEVLFGTFVLHHWDTAPGCGFPRCRAVRHPPATSRAPLGLRNGVDRARNAVRLERRTRTTARSIPPVAYYRVALCNEGPRRACNDVRAQPTARPYGPRRRGVLRSGSAAPSSRGTRANPTSFGCSASRSIRRATKRPDATKASIVRCPGPLADAAETPPSDTLGVFHTRTDRGRASRRRLLHVLLFDRRPSRRRTRFTGLPDAPARRSQAPRRTTTRPRPLDGRDARRRRQSRRAVGESQHAADELKPPNGMVVRERPNAVEQ